ncbi:hypothetical protein [Aquisphaera giovannonii]|uniref:hypothetical protein n=1 Tax=Aquisphaera giovannonii TaxID=406548 RepID=UPI0011E0272E|nr:hypothetical protein [Aquisphaera giovannonii]
MASLRLGATLSLLLLLCAASPPARAGCSARYLTMPPRAAGPALLDRLSTADAAPPAHGERSPSRPSPCSGAFCSGSPATPPTTLPSVMTEGESYRAITACTSVLPDPGSILRRADDARLAPIHEPDSIFHPPRRPGLPSTA